MKRFLVFLLCAILLAACSPSKSRLKDAIIGTWTDAQGYSIQFKPDGRGFIPGVEGKIPDTNFTYSILDESHIQIDMQGRTFAIEIRIEDDQLTWKDEIGEVLYKRTR